MKEKTENDIDNAIEELKEFINNNEIQNISVFTAKKILSELETKDKIINLILGEFVDIRYDFKFIEPNKRADKRKEVIEEYKEYYRKKVQK